jgi:hypothetical protein
MRDVPVLFDTFAICQHSNGAKLAFTDDAHDRAAFALEEWDHGVYMQPHNKAEYDAEHARAVSEGRAINASNFLDSEGRDMCLPRDGAGGVAPETTLSSYQACMDRRDELRAFDASLGGGKKRLTVLPWQVVPPAQPTVPGTYFARERVQTCRPSTATPSFTCWGSPRMGSRIIASPRASSTIWGSTSA